MRRQRLAKGDERTYAVIFDEGDEVMAGLLEVARDERIDGATFQAVGALASVRLAYFHWSTREYSRQEFDDQVEVLSLLGDIARLEDGSPKVHAHVVLGRPDFSVLGGHLEHAIVRPTLEVVLTESPAHLRRRHDDRSGLALIDLAARTPGAGA